MNRRAKIWLGVLGGLSALIVAVVILFDWNWLKPYAEAQASAELGRRVRIESLDVKLGREPLVILDGFQIGNPPEFSESSNLADFQRMEFRVDLARYFKTGEIFFPEMTLHHPVLRLEPGPTTGTPNWLVGPLDPRSAEATSPAAPEIGRLTVHEGLVHVVAPKTRTDVDILIHTEPDPNGGEQQIVASGSGRYAGAETKFEARAGSFAALRDVTARYPVDLLWEVGKTRLRLAGTVLNRTNLAGVDGKLELSGPDMSLLYPVLGLALPPTPPYKVIGHVWHSGTVVHFDKFDGIVGSSDLSGSIAVDTAGPRPILVGELNSGKTVLADLAGFVGATPGKPDAPNATKERKAVAAKDAAGDRALPSRPVDVMRMNEMDAHIVYRAKRLESEYLPLDDLMAKLDLENGRLRLQPLNFSIGKGRIATTVDVDATKTPPRWNIDAEFRNVDLKRIMQKSGGFDGAGLIGGRAKLAGTGISAADVLDSADGRATLAMTSGQISALLTELAGLDLLEALGFSMSGKERTFPIRCMVVDGTLQKGVLKTNALVLDTTDTNIGGAGWLNFRDETMSFRFEAHPKDVSLLAFRAPVNVSGTLKKPRVSIDPATTGARGALMVALGVLLTPLAALIPTIELGLGKDSDCTGLVAQAQAVQKNPRKGPITEQSPMPQTSAVPPTPQREQDPKEGQKAQGRD